ncbi:alpha-D-ribose 1-methylphosphonate 5-triphosphate diphosphatase [Papillibacter cinnamivorans]|uniref:Alpha-D-ribose 1-methylphosphonate 5-triphosphate diphosphatase n=1 Tax=Papillibacter cinnamivorans DSM 12816 TaxID=1122930 RepID=A0A1W2BBJ6_9FIRM|nr:alpha-D-ribose 1-methylphosphonate 5-triphosphate diphosphatase [Papillibacter cinnamivorans]SMC70191.1 alpha-D-ribose 1-methylphosphonate 5-triphosphate diphosphatase [Papillibacter cinnamivorans DSM 12816]
MKAIVNGRIVAPGGILENKTVLIQDGRILDLACGPEGAEQIIDAGGRYITPGFIDVHSDKIEQFIQPRPTSQMDFELALKECERELLNIGITTIYHSLSLMKDDFFGMSPLRTKASVRKFSDLVESIHSRNHLIHHRFHLRIEIDNLEAFDIARDMIEGKRVHEISFMDHTPGQGQYRSLEVYERSISGYRAKGAVSMEMEEILRYHETKETLSFRHLRELTELAHANGIAVASHDDDTEEKLAVNRAVGVDISEFPILLETARAARREGFFTVVGAPNILMGSSHSGNMSAAEAILDGCGDILCSDYYPPAILHAIFLMNRKYGVPLWEMVRRATLAPAEAMKIDGEYGSVEPGKRADLLIVDVLDGYPVITHALVDGKPVLRVEYRR